MMSKLTKLAPASVELSTGDQAFVQEAAERIRGLQRKMVADIAEIGKAL